MDYDAIVYGWRNIENKMMYVGFHKTQEEFDGYVTSSESEELRHAWSHGLLNRTILYRGTVSESITFENFILKSVDARVNPMFYNRSNGGGVGCQSFDIITKDMKKIAEKWLGGNDNINKLKREFLANKKLVKSIKKKIEAGHYVIFEEKIENLVNLPRNQVRLVDYDPDHLQEITESMRYDPKGARKLVSPVIVSVDAEGYKLILDGNHTTTAAYNAKWTTLPTIYINSSDFEDNQANYNDFGLLMNHHPKRKKSNTKEDCKKAIMNLLEVSKLEIGSSQFRECCIINLEEYFSKPTITANINSVATILKEQQDIIKYNFKKYGKSDIEQITKGCEYLNPNKAVISITSDSSYNAGVGAILNKMGGLDCWEGIMLVNHRNMHEYDRRNEHHSKLMKALERIHPNAKVEVQYLPSFIDMKNNELHQ